MRVGAGRSVSLTAPTATWACGAVSCSISALSRSSARRCSCLTALHPLADDLRDLLDGQVGQDAQLENRALVAREHAQPPVHPLGAERGQRLGLSRLAGAPVGGLVKGLDCGVRTRRRWLSTSRWWAMVTSQRRNAHWSPRKAGNRWNMPSITSLVTSSGSVAPRDRR